MRLKKRPKLHQFGAKTAQIAAPRAYPNHSSVGDRPHSLSSRPFFSFFLDFFHFFLEKKIHDIFSLSARWAPTLLPLSLSVRWNLRAARRALIGREVRVGTTHWSDWLDLGNRSRFRSQGAEKYFLSQFSSWDWNFQADKNAKNREMTRSWRH